MSEVTTIGLDIAKHVFHARGASTDEYTSWVIYFLLATRQALIWWTALLAEFNSGSSKKNSTGR